MSSLEPAGSNWQGDCTPPKWRWVQLAIGVVCMAMIANLQYGWTLFVDPIEARHLWPRAEIQVAFTIFVLVETWLVPVEAWFVDRYGPRVVVIFGGICIALAWIINSYADSLTTLYLGAIFGGVGVGAVYGTCVGNALKWFPDRRGLAAGFTAAGFGAGAALTVIPISKVITQSGYETAFFSFGIGQGLLVCMLALFLRQPGETMVPSAANKRTPQSRLFATPRNVIRTPVFWLLYLAFVMIASGGLMLAAQIGPIAKDFNVADTPVSLAGFELAALTFAISLDRIFDGFGRPFFGWISDKIGREQTMFIAFMIGAGALFALGGYGKNPTVFVIASALFFGVFGEIYSLFPATCTDTFGAKFAATNAGMLYTAKGTAAILVPIASIVAIHFGWQLVFGIAIGLNITAACLVIFIVRPQRLHYIARMHPESASSSEAMTLGLQESM
jgi:MFS transporter, OFA family, oxalate/formate antiporter